MSNLNSIDAFELNRLDLFATQTLLKVLLHHVLRSSPDPQMLAQSIADLYEGSVALFELRGVDGAKAEAAREYITTVGIQTLSESLRPAS